MPTERLYRLQKLVRRNNGLRLPEPSSPRLSLAGTFNLAVHPGAESASNAVAERSRAETESRKSTAITAFLQKTLASPGSQQRGSNMKVADVLSLASTLSERLSQPQNSGRNPNNPGANQLSKCSSMRMPSFTGPSRFAADRWATSMSLRSQPWRRWATFCSIATVLQRPRPSPARRSPARSPRQGSS